MEKFKYKEKSAMQSGYSLESTGSDTASSLHILLS